MSSGNNQDSKSHTSQATLRRKSAYRPVNNIWMPYKVAYRETPQLQLKCMHHSYIFGMKLQRFRAREQIYLTLLIFLLPYTTIDQCRWAVAESGILLVFYLGYLFLISEIKIKQWCCDVFRFLDFLLMNLICRWRSCLFSPAILSTANFTNWVWTERTPQKEHLFTCKCCRSLLESTEHDFYYQKHLKSLCVL